jgi:hypothetical protein
VGILAHCVNVRIPFALIPPTRQEMLAVLVELCELSPEVRIGQLLAHLGFLGEDQTGRSPWDMMMNSSWPFSITTGQN